MCIILNHILFLILYILYVHTCLYVCIDIICIYISSVKTHSAVSVRETILDDWKLVLFSNRNRKNFIRLKVFALQKLGIDYTL